MKPIKPIAYRRRVLARQWLATQCTVQAAAASAASATRSAEEVSRLASSAIARPGSQTATSSKEHRDGSESSGPSLS